MKRAIPSLNPQAASYTPLGKRITEVKTKIAELSDSPSKGLFKTEQCQSEDQESSGASSHVSKDSQNSSDHTKKKNVDDSHDMTLAYLAFLFPNISEQCLAHVYFLDETDLDATTDMLEELERAPDNLAKHKPDVSDVAGTSGSQVSDPKYNVLDTGLSPLESSFGNSSDVEKH